MPFTAEQRKTIEEQTGGTYYAEYGPSEFIDSELYEVWIEKKIEEEIEYDVAYVLTKNRAIVSIFENFADFAIAINRKFNDFSSAKFEQGLKQLVYIVGIVLLTPIIGIFLWKVLASNEIDIRLVLLSLASVAASIITFLFGRWIIFRG
jgi:hypothetical protein